MIRKTLINKPACQLKMRLLKACSFSLAFMAVSAFTPSTDNSLVSLETTGTRFRSRTLPTISSKLASTLLTSHANSNIRQSTTSIFSKSTSNTDKKSDINPSLSTSLISASYFFILDFAFRRALQRAAISFPSALAGCLTLFMSLLAIPMGETIFGVLSPGAALLAKWLPVFFVPSLITFPLSGGMGSAIEVLKVLFVIVGGFYFTLLTTAASVVGVRKAFASKTDVGTLEAIDNEETEKGASISTSKESNPPPKAYSDETVLGLRILTLFSGVAAVMTTLAGSTLSQPFVTLFMLSTTLHNFVFGARLPKSFTKAVHPLVTCTTLTWAVATAFATLTGSTFKSILKSFKTGVFSPLGSGAGDILLYCLGPSVVSLGVSMYDRRKLMQQNIKEVTTAVAVSSVGGLFGTAAVARLLQIGNPYLRLSLISRNITSSLALSIAAILGANTSLAVAFVVLTGVFGANFGASILDKFGIKDAVARGLGMGAAAHGLGTAAIVNEKDAFPFAAIAMALTASMCTVLVSIPVLRRLILQLALG